jgi:hypothetical protein
MMTADSAAEILRFYVNGKWERPLDGLPAGLGKLKHAPPNRLVCTMVGHALACPETAANPADRPDT